MELVSAYLYCTIYLNRTTMRQIQVKHNGMIPGEQKYCITNKTEQNITTKYSQSLYQKFKFTIANF